MKEIEPGSNKNNTGEEHSQNQQTDIGKTVGGLAIGIMEKARKRGASIKFPGGFILNPDGSVTKSTDTHSAT